MADGVFNIAKGQAVEMVENNTDSLVVLLLKANEAEADLIDHDTVNSLLGAAGNTEADFTNYARKTGISETVNIDDASDETTIDAPDQTWASAGNGTNNTLTKAVVCVQTGADDTTLIPLTHHDFSVTTDGTDLTLEFHADGFYRAS